MTKKAQIEVAIRMAPNAEPILVKVEGEIPAPGLAVHKVFRGVEGAGREMKPVFQERGGWQITHQPSGKRIDHPNKRFGTKRKALEAAERVSGLLDWDRPEKEIQEQVDIQPGMADKIRTLLGYNEGKEKG